MSSSSLSKSEKERTKLVQDKCQQMLNDLLRDEDNKYCVDCDAKGPRWASWNLGVFLCIRCAGIHRNLGVHISKVKSVNLDTWTPEQVVSMTTMGNSRGRAVYEANIPESFRRPQTDTPLENFIRAKYEHKKYIAKEFIPTPIGKVDWTAEIDEIIASKGRKKAQPSTTPLMFPKLAIPPPAVGEKRVVQPVELKPVEKTPSDTNFFDLSDILIDTSSSVAQPPPTNQGVGVVLDSSELLQELTLSEPEQRKMTKESILSLYGNQQGQNPFMFQQQPPPPPQQQQNPPVQNPGYNSAPYNNTNYFN